MMSLEVALYSAALYVVILIVATIVAYRAGRRATREDAAMVVSDEVAGVFERDLNPSIEAARPVVTNTGVFSSDVFGGGLDPEPVENAQWGDIDSLSQGVRPIDWRTREEWDHPKLGAWAAYDRSLQVYLWWLPWNALRIWWGARQLKRGLAALAALDHLPPPTMMPIDAEPLTPEDPVFPCRGMLDALPCPHCGTHNDLTALYAMNLVHEQATVRCDSCHDLMEIIEVNVSPTVSALKSKLPAHAIPEATNV